MQVPVYQRQVQQQGLPNARENIQVDASNFLGGTEAAALKYGENALDNVNKAVQHHYVQQLYEANKTRAQSAVNDLNKHDQHAYNHTTTGPDGKPVFGGWANVSGQDVFKQPNGKLLQDNVMDERNQKISEIAAGLGNDEQRNAFMEYANKSGTLVQGRIEGHMAQEYRRFQTSTLQDTIDTESNNVALFNNDLASMQSSADKIHESAKQLSALNGLGEDHANAIATQALSKSYRGAINTAIQQNNTQGAKAILDHFGEQMDANDLNNAKNSVFDAWAANGIQTNPQSVADMTKPRDNTAFPAMSLEQVKALRDKLESHGKDFNADGTPVIHIDKDGIASKYKNQVRTDVAFKPGFGIKPATNDSPEEFNRVGDEILKSHYDHHQGDVEKTLAAYNAGRAGVDEALKAGGDWQSAAGVKGYLDKAKAEVFKTGTPLDYASPQDLLRVNRAANSAVDTGRSVFAANLKNQFDNQYAQASNTGNAGDMIPLQTFQQAYGDQAPEKYAEYQDQISHAKTYYSIKDMPIAQLQATLEEARPKDANTENKPKDLTDKFNTSLSPEQEAEFQKWAKDNHKEKDTYDYDLRGAWLDLTSGKMTQADNGHLGDKYKKPNHPTFSDQSIYHNNDSKGGQWIEENGKTSFIPSDLNIKNLGVGGLKKYFDQVEKGNEVKIPSQTFNADNAEREWKQYNDLLSVAQHAQSIREKDPISYAAQSGYAVKSINWSNPQQAASELANRMAVSDQLTQKFGTPSTLLTSDEAKGLSKTFDAMPAKSALELMDTLHKNVDSNSYQMAMQQLHKDSPVTALAGSLYGVNETYQESHWFGGPTALQVNGKQAAEYVLKGERILNPTKGDKSENGTPPKLFEANESAFKTSFDAATNGAFAGNPTAASNTYQAVRAAYAAICAEKGNLGGGIDKINPESFDKALSLVTGGVVKNNGKYVIPPYGMPEDVFKDKLSKGYYAQMNAPTQQRFNGLLNDATIHNVAPGVYGFSVGETLLPGVVDLNKPDNTTVDQINP